MAITKLFCLLLMALSGAGEATINDAADNSITFTSIQNAREWILGDERSYRVVSESNWREYYSNPPVGADFGKYIYIVASRGSQPNPGYRIRIAAISQEKEKIHVFVELLQPDPGMEYMQVIVTPTAVAAIEKTQLRPFPKYEFLFTGQSGLLITAKTLTP
jgi:hypothetical protein